MSTQVKMAAQRERPHSETILADECFIPVSSSSVPAAIFTSRHENLKDSHHFLTEGQFVRRTGCLANT